MASKHKRDTLDVSVNITMLENGCVAIVDTPGLYWTSAEKMYFPSREEAVNYLGFRAGQVVKERLSEKHE